MRLYLANPFGALALAAVAAVVVLHLVESRRLRVAVPTLVIWKKVLAAAAAPSRPLSRLDALLALRLLLAAALALAVAAPVLVTAGRAAARAWLVVDNSLTMQSWGRSGRSRLAEASDAARGELAALGPGGEAAVLITSPRARAAAGMGPASAARSALAAIEPSDAPGRLDEAVATALALSGTGGDVRVFTDRPRAASLPGSVLWRSFGEPSRNMAIVAMDARPLERAEGAGGGAAARLFLAVRNYSGESRRARLVASGVPGGQALARGEIELQPLGRSACIMELPIPAGLRAVEVALDAEDDLAPDNFARALVSSRRPFRVALVGRSSPAVARAVRAVEEGSELVELATGGGESAPDADMTVYSGVLPRAALRGERPAMFVFPGASVGPLVVDPQALRVAAPIEPAAGAGLLAGLDLSAVRAPRIGRVSVTGAFRVLATAGGVPVLGEWEDGSARRYYLGLIPDEGSWPDDPSWPILWARLAERHAPPAAGRLHWREVSDDSPLRGVSEGAEVTGPRGGGRPADAGLSDAGFYSAGGGLVAAVNVLDELASDNRPAPGPSASAPAGGGPRLAGRPVERAMRPWLLAAALALMLAEALVAARR